MKGLKSFLAVMSVLFLVGFFGLSLSGCGSEGESSASGGNNNPAASTENKGIAGLTVTAHFARKGEESTRASRFLSGDQRRSLETAMETRVIRVDAVLSNEYGSFEGAGWIDEGGNVTFMILYIEKIGAYSLRLEAKDWHNNTLISTTSEVVISEGDNKISPELFLEDKLPIDISLAGIPMSNDEYGFKLYVNSEWGFQPVEGDFYSQYDPTVVTGLIPVSEKSFGFNAGGRRYYFDIQKALDAMIEDAPLDLSSCDSSEMPSLSAEVTVNHKNIVVPDDYSTIQAAINAAVAGDVVKIRHGYYCDYDPDSGDELPILLKSGVNIVGDETYPDEVIISGKIIGSGAGSCVVKGINCPKFHANSGFDLTLEHCITGLITVASSTLRLSNCTILGENDPSNGIVISQDSGLFVKNCLFCDFSATGIPMELSSGVIEYGNCFFSNTIGYADKISGEGNKFGHVDFSEWGGYYTPASDEVTMPDGSYAGAIRPWREPDYSEYYW